MSGKNHQAEIGIIGGSGFYGLLADAKEVEVNTPYGQPSDKITIGDFQGRKIAFLPRHGKKHQYPPHKIPYQANIAALEELGVHSIIAPAAVGSLQADVQPGSFVICDEFVDRTGPRKDTYFNGPQVMHIPSVSPYCPVLRKLAISEGKKLNIPIIKQGTVVVIEGPRFSSGPESKWFSAQGWEVVNMTQYPEVILAREKGMCYLNISLVTDYDVGLEKEDIKPVTANEVAKVFKKNNEKVKELIFSLIPQVPQKRTCGCEEILKEAEI